MGFNNGDPALYNPAARGLFMIVQQLGARGALTNLNAVQTWTSLARRPIEVSKAQRDYCAQGRRVVGGKPQDLAIRPNGEYSSSTGD
jgi:hypothetical protein